jgi:cytochrome c5
VAARCGISVVQNTDTVFLKHFAQVIAALFAIMVVLIIGAWMIYDRQGFHDENPAQVAEADRRIAPVGAAYSGETGRAAILAAEAAARAAATASVAFDGALDAELIYKNVCAACHDTGAGGAPKSDKTAWAPRIAKGLDTLVKHGIEGFQGEGGIMPAKGGRADLTDEQVRITVEYMYNKYR